MSTLTSPGNLLLRSSPSLPRRSWVADVNIARPNGKLIRRCQALKKFSVKLLEARAQVKKHSPGTPLKGGSKAWKLAKAEIKLKKLEDKVRAGDQKRATIKGKR